MILMTQLLRGWCENNHGMQHKCTCREKRVYPALSRDVLVHFDCKPPDVFAYWYMYPKFRDKTHKEVNAPFFNERHAQGRFDCLYHGLYAHPETFVPNASSAN